MKFIVRVSGNPFGTTPGTREIYRGPNTHMRSEGSWLLGVALNLARYGHEVIISEYQWGNLNEYPLPPNIRLMAGCGGECDVFIDCGWDNVHTVRMYSQVKARIYIHGWGGVPQSSHMLDFVTERGITNHFIARTSRACGQESNKYPYGIYMPVPIVDKIKPLGNFSSNKMLWANRGAFNEAYRGDSEPVLDFMERYQDEYEYKVLLWGDIKEKALMTNHPEIVLRFEKLRKVALLEPYTGIPNNEFLKELRESKILLDTGHPGIHPQNLEAVCMGCIPLVYTDREHHFYDDAGFRIPDQYKFNGPHGIHAIMKDEELYQKYFAELSLSAKDHEHDNAYNILMEGINGKLQ